MCKRKKLGGFTLVEMLIVIAIIAILSTMILRGVGGALPKSRDARRMGDLKNVQSSLEVYYNKTGTYPNITASDPTGWQTLESTISGVLGSNFKLPRDPSGGTNTYYYCPGAASPSGAINSYILGAQLEVTSSTEGLSGETCGKPCGGQFYCVGM